MAPPVAAFTVIPLADVDPDSPVSTDLMNALRLNDQNLFAQLVGDPVAAPPFVPAAAHNHDGVNSAAVAGANLRFVASAEVAGAAVASVMFAGLDGNVDEHYVLYGTVIRSVNYVDLQIRLNGLAASYVNSDDALTAGIILEPTTVTIGLFVKFEAHIYARNSIQGVDIYPSVFSATGRVGIGATAVRFENVGARVSIVLPAPNITSLEIITGTGGTPIGIGSRFVLYKLAET